MKAASRAQARQYARALLELAEERAGPEPLRLRGELRQLVTLLERPDLRSAMTHPGVDSASRRRALAAIVESAGASELLVRLVDLLASRDHLLLLPPLAEVYGANLPLT